MLTKESLFNIKALPVAVEIPFASEAVAYVRSLSAGEFMALSEKVKADEANAYVHWFIACLTDEAGTPICTDADAEKVKTLPIRVVEAVVAKAQEVNVPGKDTTDPNSKKAA